jgi:hypothetical protein
MSLNQEKRVPDTLSPSRVRGLKGYLPRLRSPSGVGFID